MTPGAGVVPDEVDLLVFGSGISGIIAALRAKALGQNVIVAEKTEVFGGSSALSGGLLWIPNHPLQHEDGIYDSAELGLQYLDAVIDGYDGPCASPERRRAFIKSGPEMITFLRSQGAQLARCAGYSDYYDKPGGLPEGRAVRGVAFDLHRLGEWERTLRGRLLFAGLAMHTEEMSATSSVVSTLRGKATVAKVLARTAMGKVRGQHVETVGNGLMAQMLYLAVQKGIPLYNNLAIEDVVVEGGRAVGAVLRRSDGSTVTVRAHGTVLACGGFAHNEAMRKEHGKQPASTEWTVASPGDTGDGILAGARAGGALALMDEAIWMGTALAPGAAVPMFYMFDRTKPHSLLVDSSGQRFVNESTDYMRLGQAIYERHRTVPSIPSWLIIDARHRNTYILGDVFPRLTPRSWLREGFLKKAATLRELAHGCGIDPHALEATVTRFNAMARAGRDTDFGRGDTHYDRYFGDPSCFPNPSLGPVEKPPFYAVPVHPGDVGTAGGLLCDEHARVLRDDGSVIEGLYAAGNNAAPPHGPTYPGPGASIGAGATFGYVAATHSAAHA